MNDIASVNDICPLSRHAFLYHRLVPLPQRKSLSDKDTPACTLAAIYRGKGSCHLCLW